MNHYSKKYSRRAGLLYEQIGDRGEKATTTPLQANALLRADRGYLEKFNEHSVLMDRCLQRVKR